MPESPSLLPPEIAAIQAAAKDHVQPRALRYSGGGMVALAGNRALFASGGERSFGILWALAQPIYDAVAPPCTMGPMSASAPIFEGR